MKKNILLVSLLFPAFMFAQEISFSKKDTTRLSLQQIQEATNTFISQKWNETTLMSKDVTDHSAVITAMTEVRIKGTTGEDIYTITYGVNFILGEKSFEIQITDVTCVEGNLMKGGRVLSIPKVQPDFHKEYFKNKKEETVTNELKSFFEKLITDYRSALI